MRIVRHGKGNAGLTVQAQKPLGGFFLYLKVMVLYLKIEIALAEKLVELYRLGFRLLVISGAQHAGYRTGDAAGKAHKPLGVLVQELPIYPRFNVKALGERRRDEVAEVFIARLVFAQQDKMRILGINGVILVKAGAGRNIHLAADDGLYPLGKAGFIKRDCAVHYAVVGYRNGGLSQLLDALCKPLNAAGTVEQRKLGMNM